MEEILWRTVHRKRIVVVASAQVFGVRGLGFRVEGLGSDCHCAGVAEALGAKPGAGCDPEIAAAAGRDT